MPKQNTLNLTKDSRGNWRRQNLGFVVKDGQVHLFFIEDLRRDLQGGDADRKIRAASVLAWLGPAAADAVPDLTRCLQDNDQSVRESAQYALMRIKRQ